MAKRQLLIQVKLSKTSRNKKIYKIKHYGIGLYDGWKRGLLKKMKKIIVNIIGLLVAIAIFSSSVVFAASYMGKVEPIDTKANASSDLEKDLYQSDIYIGDLLFTPSNITSSVPSSDMPIEVSSEVSIDIPSSKVPSKSSSKPKPKPSSIPSSKPSSNASSNIVSSNVSSSEPPVESTPEDELLMILSGAVQREIVGTNTVPKQSYYEAYKAQAVACNSYMEYYKNRTGIYPTMSYSTPHAKTIELVRSVMSEHMYYSGTVINASYHAASGGYTQSASYIWGQNVPFLQAVESRYDNYDSTFTISVSDAMDKLSANGITVSGDPSSWFDLSNATLTDGGFINTISICGTVVKGRTLRENIFGSANLKSCKITNIAVSGDNTIFSTKGYGHGAGMSQLGALGLSANEGFSYQQILKYYYTGVSIQ